MIILPGQPHATSKCLGGMPGISSPNHFQIKVMNIAPEYRPK